MRPALEFRTLVRAERRRKLAGSLRRDIEGVLEDIDFAAAISRGGGLPVNREKFGPLMVDAAKPTTDQAFPANLAFRGVLLILLVRAGRICIPEVPFWRHYSIGFGELGARSVCWRVLLRWRRRVHRVPAFRGKLQGGRGRAESGAEGSR